jgi:uncharacterized membrane-anchored protein
MKWSDFLSFDNSVDGLLRLVFVALAAGFLIMYSMIFESQYSDKLIDLYTKPWWRILLVILIIASAIWCPRVGILVALVGFFYFSDMETLISPLGMPQQ